MAEKNQEQILDGEQEAELEQLKVEGEPAQAVENEVELQKEGPIEGEEWAERAEIEGEEAPAEEAQVDELTALREQLEEAQSQSAEYLDGWQRARAEFANYRRRQEQRQRQMATTAKSRLLTNLLPVLDDMERAFQVIPEEARDGGWAEGLSLVGHKLQAVLEKEGLSLMGVQPGDEFDPNVHEAVLHEPCEGWEEGRIARVFQQGYRLDDIVLRPALVSVSSGRIEKEE